MNKQRLYIDNKTDRESVAMALLRQGFAVRFGAEKKDSKTSRAVRYFVEWWEEKE
jgi:hypothetical protein